MTSKRSPNCPAHDLEESITKVSAIYWAEGRNSFSGEEAVIHMGYNGLNGASRRALGAVRAFGLVEGRGEQLKVSDDAVLIIADADAEDQREREGALQRALCYNRVFSDLFEQFDGASPNRQLSGFLQKKYHFKPLAADSTAEVYKRSLALLFSATAREDRGQSDIDESTVSFSLPAAPVPARQDPGADNQAPPENRQAGTTGLSNVPVMPAFSDSTVVPDDPDKGSFNASGGSPSGNESRQDRFSMTSGAACLIWPRGISAEEFEDFTDWLILEHRKISRQVAGRNLPLLKRKKHKNAD